MDLLTHLKEGGHRVLIFSQSTKMLDLIEVALDETKRSWPRLRMDGSVNKVADRKALVDEYNTNSNIFLFLMTTQVGGVGITLTSADRVVIFDPAWNTAMDDQAADRVYRIGQTRDVIIYRLISSGTIEEKMYRKQVFKGALSKSLLGKEAAVHTYFTRGELRELFIFHPDEIREPKTQNLLSTLHSHKRDTYPALERELAYLSQLKTLVGMTDHNLLYTEEASQIKSHAELDEYAAGAHLALSKTIAPKDVIESEQKEAAIRMARGQRGPVNTIYVDDDSAPRARRDPSQVGSKVGDITLLTIDDQFELGLMKMQATREKPRQNPFASAPRSRPGHNFGGNDRVSALPTVKRSSDASLTVTKPGAPQTGPKKSGTSAASPVSLPTVSTKSPTSNAPSKKDQGKTAAVPATTSQPIVSIKKSGGILPMQPTTQKAPVKPASPAAAEVADDDVDDLLSMMDKVSISRSTSSSGATAVPSASKHVDLPSTTSKAPASVVKPKNRRIIDEDDDDDILAPMPLLSSSSSVKSVETSNKQESLVDSSVSKAEKATTSVLPAAVPEPSPTSPSSSAVEAQDESDEEIVERPESPEVRRPKPARKSIITFTVIPDEDELEAFALGAETLDQEPEVVNEDDEDEESDSDDENGSECSEASESEFEIAAAQGERSSRSAPNKHFVEATGNTTDDEEADAKDIDDESDDESESTAGDDDSSSLNSFIASEDEEEDAEDDVVEVDEHALMIQRLLSQKKDSPNMPALSHPSTSPASPIDLTLDKKTSSANQAERLTIKSTDPKEKEAIQRISNSNGQMASSRALESDNATSTRKDAIPTDREDGKVAGRGEAHQGAVFAQPAKSSGGANPSYSFTQARSKRRIVESDDED